MLGFSYEMLISNKDVSTNEASDFCNRRIRRLSDIDESKEASSESDLLLMKYDLDKSNRDSGQSSGYFEWSSSSSIQQSEYSLALVFKVYPKVFTCFLCLLL